MPVSSAARYLKRMEEEGTVVHEGRSGYITAEQLEFIGNAAAVPFCGTVSCGLPADTALETAQYEYFPFPSSFLRSGEYFLLEAEGDSMTGDRWQSENVCSAFYSNAFYQFCQGGIAKKYAKHDAIDGVSSSICQ